jgi:hypothetical protein
MSPHDFLDGEQPDAQPAATEPAVAPNRRARRRLARAEQKEAKAEARSAYRSKIRDARQAPRSPLVLLIVGVLFFGAIVVAGTIASQNSALAPATPSPTSSGEAPARASSATPTPTLTSSATSAGRSEQTIASNWLIAYFAGHPWQQYVAPDAVPALTATRAPFFNGTYLQGDSVNIQEYTWRDVSTTADGWAGTVDVILEPGRPVPLYASLKVTMSTGGAPQVTSVSTTFYGESPD